MNDIIYKNLYVRLSNNLKKKSAKDFKRFFSGFISRHLEELTATTPSHRVYYTGSDEQELLEFTGIEKSSILESVSEAYYFKIKSFNPAAMKHDITLLILCLYRYCYLNKVEVNSALIYLCFSPKVYLSIHSGFFKIFPPDANESNLSVMEYTIYSGSNKLEFKKAGSTMKAVESIGNTWENTYKNRIKSNKDEDLVYIFQQLRDRIKSSLSSVVRAYYDNLDKPGAIIFKSSDNLSDDNYRLTGSDSGEITHYTDKAMSYIINNGVNEKICKAIDAAPIIRYPEIRSLIETILSDPEAVLHVETLIHNMIALYYEENADAKSRDSRDIRNVSFINYAISKKPNSNNERYLTVMREAKYILSTKSERYNKRKKRKPTESLYVTTLITYLALSVHKAAL